MHRNWKKNTETLVLQFCPPHPHIPPGLDEMAEKWDFWSNWPPKWPPGPQIRVKTFWISNLDIAIDFLARKTSHCKFLVPNDQIKSDIGILTLVWPRFDPFDPCFNPQWPRKGWKRFGIQIWKMWKMWKNFSVQIFSPKDQIKRDICSLTIIWPPFWPQGLQKRAKTFQNSNFDTTIDFLVWKNFQVQIFSTHWSD